MAESVAALFTVILKKSAPNLHNHLAYESTQQLDSNQEQYACIRCGDFSQLENFYVSGIPVCEACISSSEQRLERDEENSVISAKAILVIGLLIALFAAFFLIEAYFGLGIALLLIPFTAISKKLIDWFNGKDPKDPIEEILDSYPGSQSVKDLELKHCRAMIMLEGGGEGVASGVLVWNSNGALLLTPDHWLLALPKRLLTKVAGENLGFLGWSHEMVSVQFNSEIPNWVIEGCDIYLEGPNKLENYKSLLESMSAD